MSWIRSFAFLALASSFSGLCLAQGGGKSAEGEKTAGMRLYEEKRIAEAIVVLTRALQDPSQEKERPANMACLALCYAAQEKYTMSEGLWRNLCEQYPHSELTADGYCFMAQRARLAKEEAQSLEFLKKGAVFHKRRIAGGWCAYDLGHHYHKKGETLVAWRWFTQAIRSELPRERRSEIKALLDPMVEEFLMYQRAPEEVSHKVRPGESLTSIAGRYASSPGLIRWLNGMQDWGVRPGETIKVIRSPLQMELSRNGKFLVLFFKNGYYLRSFDVALGPQVREGNFTVSAVFRNPAWENGGRSVPPGDPENILGSCQISFLESGDVCIHGTNRPEIIGTGVADGSVHLRNEEVRFVGEVVSQGTPLAVW